MRFSDVFPRILVVILLAGLPAHAAIVFNSLFSFNSTNGSSPNSLIQGKDGNLYGTTASGGSTNAGTVFKFTTNGALTSLTSFSNLSNSSSLNPDGLVQKADGSFFGASFNGGVNGAGSLFNLDTNFVPSYLVNFNHTNGAQPHVGAIYNPGDGNYYGTTVGGGTNGFNGSIYKLSSNGTFTSFFSFNNTNGSAPYSTLTLASDGYMYGTTSYGGSNGAGTIFRISTNGVLTSLYSFAGGADGAFPQAGLAQASDGFFYGTTSQAGAGTHGTIFRVDSSGHLTTLLAFNGTNGATAYSTLVENAGWLYGTTYFGGPYGDGTVFRINTNGTFTNLVFFNGTNGANPLAALLNTGNGVLYGTTTAGGTNGTGYGTIFQLSVPPALPTRLNVSESGNSLTFNWTSVPGQPYQLQSANDLTVANWTNNGPVITATGTNTSTSDTVKPGQMFYRLLVPPQ